MRDPITDPDWPPEPTDAELEAMDEAREQEYDDIEAYNASEMDGSKHIGRRG